MKCEYTSDEIASLASRGLRLGKDALTDQEFRAVCGSDLTQARPHGPLSNAFMLPPPTPYELEMWWAARRLNGLRPPRCPRCGQPADMAHFCRHNEHFDPPPK